VGKKKHAINIMLTVTLLGVFALAALTVAVLGAHVYESSADLMKSNYDTRTSLVYLSEKVRQSGDGELNVGNVGKNDALIIDEDINGEKYHTYIYVYDSSLYELFISDEFLAAQSGGVEPDEGQKIMDLKSLKIKEEDGLIKFSTESDGGEKDNLSITRRMQA
jgi:hypothetical protein